MLSKEQRDAARSDPLSFRYAAGRGAGSSHEEAVTWLKRLVEQGAVRPVGPAVLVYRQSEGDITATGIIGDVPLHAYDLGLVKRHEAILAKTERKMADYIRSTRVQGNPVALAHRGQHDPNSAIAAQTVRSADTTFTSVDGVLHELWVAEGDSAEALRQQYGDSLYVIDGHHRLAGASLVARQEGRGDARVPGALFSTSEVRLRAFARCVFEPGFDVGLAVDRLRADFAIEEVGPAEARPRDRLEFGMRLGRRHFRLRVNPQGLPNDLDRLLPVNLLQDLILGPVFGIDNPGADERIRFVPDLPGRLQPDTKADAWLLPFPATVGDVIAVADRGGVMPPKSTWFAPKLPSGLVIRMVEPI
jgi:uncharacterized protein (DUF1015 family)